MSFGVSLLSVRPHSMTSLQKAAPRLTTPDWTLMRSVITFFARASRVVVRCVSTSVRQLSKSSPYCKLSTLQTVPTGLLLGPFRHVANTGRRVRDHVVGLRRGEQKGALESVRHRLTAPDRVEVQHLLFAIRIVEHLRHSIGYDVGAVPALVPRLLRHLSLQFAEDQCLGDQSTVPELVILRIALRPSLADLLGELGKVLLRASRDDMRVPGSRIFELGEIRLA